MEKEVMANPVKLPVSYKLGLIGAVLKSPSLYKTALVQYKNYIPKHWHKTFPYLPKIPKEFLDFRLFTMYGSKLPSKKVFLDDTVKFLKWCKNFSTKI